MDKRRLMLNTMMLELRHLLTTGSPKEQDTVAEAVIHAIRDLDFDALAIAQEYEEEADIDESGPSEPLDEWEQERRLEHMTYERSQ